MEKSIVNALVEMGYDPNDYQTYSKAMKDDKLLDELADKLSLTPDIVNSYKFRNLSPDAISERDKARRSELRLKVSFKLMEAACDVA